MSLRSLLLALFLGFGLALPPDQIPLTVNSVVKSDEVQTGAATKGRELKGKFLHITGTILPFPPSVAAYLD